jgi:hypothetical protein
MSNLPPPTFRYPFPLADIPKAAQQAHIYSFNAIQDLQQAIVALRGQVNTAQTTATSAHTTATAATSPGVTSFNSSTGAVTYFPQLGTIDNQTGVTAYTLQDSDNGALLVFNDASPIAVTLNSAISAPFITFVTNFGAGTATLIPQAPALINGVASFALLQNYFAVVIWDQTNWYTSAALLPQNTPAITHQWINSYNSVTGAFTQSQPNANDVSNPYTVISTTYAILTTDYQIECTSGTFTATLPTAVGVVGKVYSIKNTGAGTVTLATTSAQTIDGSLTQTLTQWDNLVVMSNGANWIII